MKVRSDFVTNSSSSSFIVVFNSKKEYENRLENMLKSGIDPEYASVIARDIGENRVTKEAALKEIREALRDSFEFSYFYNGMGRYVPYSEQLIIMKSKEFKDKCNAYVDKEMKLIEEKLPNRGYYASVIYGDDDGAFYSDLEHNIMPYQKFVIKQISHH